MRRRKRTRNNIITTIALICAMIMITLLPLPVAEAANFTVSKSNISLETGKSSTITINAPTHTGRLDITSSNSNVATTSNSSLWVENDSKTITITAKSAGIATITIKGELYDAGAEEEKEFIRTINVTVTKASSSGSTNLGSPSGGGTQNGNTSGNTSNNNQSSNSGSSSSSSSNSGTNSSGSQSSTSTSKPNSSTSSQKPSSSSSSSKPSSSSSATTSKPVENNTTTPVEEVVQPQENNVEVIENETENLIEEMDSEDVTNEELDEDIKQEIAENAEIDNAEESNAVSSKGKAIIIAAVGVVAVLISSIGIFISKKIFKK